MREDLASTAFLHVAYRPDSDLLVCRWLCTVTEPQLRQGYETMRAAALQHHSSYWLVDSRRRTDRRLNGPEWVVNTFLPRLQREMGRPLCVAFLALPNHLREITADPTIPQQAPSPRDPFQFARFIDEGAANSWLERQRGAGLGSGE